MGLRLFYLIALLLMAAAAAASVVAASFAIPRFTSPFGDTKARFGILHWLPGSDAPFPLGTTAAIHLGNTKSCIAGYWNRDPGSVYRFCIPSWVAFTDKGGTLSGEAAREHAALSPGTAVSGFTRLIHRRPNDPVVEKEMELVPYNLTTELGWASIQLETGQIFSPDHLAGILISELKRMAEAHLGREIVGAVITVPSHLTDDGRGRVEFAGTWHAGFQDVKVVDEQIAAGAAHGHHTEQGDGKVVLVLHVGGRTSHATIFTFVKGRALLIKATRDLFLGGDDFTARVVDHLVELVKQRHGVDIRHDKAALLRLTAACEQAKRSLSEQHETVVQVESLVDGVDLFSARLTRAKFEELNRDLFERAMGLVDWVVMNARVVEERRGTLRRLVDAAVETVTGRSRAAESRKGFVDEIVVVGGSCRIPKIRELVKDYFRGREPNGGEVEPDEAVIHGAMLLTRPEAAVYLGGDSPVPVAPIVLFNQSSV